MSTIAGSPPQIVTVGSQEHKALFCGSFISTHEPYEPENLPWPDLDAQSVALLRAIPVWSMAMQVEINAGAMLAGFARTQSDPLIRQALELQGYEEARHGRMIATLVERYGLPAEVEGPQLRPTRKAFVDFGYNECLDSFFGFGVFRIAREVRLFPESLTSLFSRVLREEARHIVFFVNWIAYERALRGFGATILQALPTAAGYARAVLKTLGRARQAKTEDKGLTAVGTVFEELTLGKFLRACIVENDMHMSQFDDRLLRPRVVPTLARIVSRFSKA